MTYQQSIDFLFNKLPLFSRIGSAAIKNSLENIKALCHELGDPENRFPSIHIAGTNGKGSVSHQLASVLQTAGFKTGLYTSPHLYDFRERIKINGEMVPEDFVIHFVEKIGPLMQRIDASFFEITVAMAFSFFAEQKVDIAVIEVGLGGRLDSTNIINPILSVITNISLDHTNLLGHSVAEIAVEKGGIIKENTPVVIGERALETAPIFTQIAAKKNAAIFFAEDTFKVNSYQLGLKQIELEIENKKDDKTETYRLDLPGIYQTKNIITVLQSVQLLQQTPFKISDVELKEGLETVKIKTGLQGRWEVLQTEPTLVLEVAHNEAGVHQMLEHLSKLSYKKLYLIIGFVKDKDIKRILELLPKSATYYFTQAHIPRALAVAELMREAGSFQLKGAEFPDVNCAIQQAISVSEKEDLVLVCGSIFLVAEVDRIPFNK